MRMLIPCMIIASAVGLTSACIAAEQENFSVSIAGFRESQENYETAPENAPEGLPVVFYPMRVMEQQTLVVDTPSSNSFYVLIRNCRERAVKIKMSDSNCYECLSFEIGTGSNDFFCVGRALVEKWNWNKTRSWMFAAGGSRVMAVDFCNGSWIPRNQHTRAGVWELFTNQDGTMPVPWEEFVTPNKKPLLRTMRAIFRYYDADVTNMVTISSPPTEISLCPKKAESSTQPSAPAKLAVPRL